MYFLCQFHVSQTVGTTDFGPHVAFLSLYYETSMFCAALLRFCSAHIESAVVFV